LAALNDLTKVDTKTLHPHLSSSIQYNIVELAAGWQQRWFFGRPSQIALAIFLTPSRSSCKTWGNYVDCPARLKAALYFCCCFLIVADSRADRHPAYSNRYFPEH
jgi:hypothetical protein